MTDTACHDSREKVATTRQAVSAGPLGPIGVMPADPDGFDEMNPAAVVTFADLGPQLVIAFDRFQIKNTSNQRFAWGFSPHPGTDAFVLCSNKHSDCNNPSSPQMLTIPNHKRWLGHPAIAYEGAGGNIVIVTEVDTTGDDVPERIVAAVSNDGGRSFGTQPTKVVEVNDAQTSGDCADGINMTPSVSVDYSMEPPVFHVAWNNEKHSNFGACYRTFHFDPITSDFVPLSNAQGVSNDHSNSAVVGASDAIGTVLLKTDEGGESTAPLADCGNPKYDTWTSKVTVDSGNNWSDPTDIRKDLLGHCPFGNRLVTGLRGWWDFVVAPDGTTYFANLSSSNQTGTADQIRIFMSSSRGGLVRGTDLTWWRELCGPSNNVHWSEFKKKGFSQFACSSPAFATSPGQEFFNVSLAADELGNLLLTYNETDATTTKVHVTGQLLILPRTPRFGTVSIQRDLAADFDPGTQFAISFPWLGLYNDVATNSARRFDSYVAGCTVPPGGIFVVDNNQTLTGGFFPVWVQRDQGGPAVIATRLVSVAK